MKEYYYCLDGQTVDGPHAEREMQELLSEQVLQPTTLVCAAGEKEWIPLSTVSFSGADIAPPRSRDLTPPPSSEPAVSVDHQAVAAAGNDNEDDPPEEDRGPSKHQLIKAIRSDLDLLWKAQRESLISHIRGLELEPIHETTRKQAKSIKARVKEASMHYWTKSRSFDAWIEELVWKDCDIQRKLRGNGCEEKFEDAKQWLTDAKLIEKSGCYCFKDKKDYLYIGKSENLGDRIRQHRHAVWFEQATHLRIVIPRHKAWISKLERLLLLSQPHARYNEATPIMGNNPADDTLELLEKEMTDLLTD